MLTPRRAVATALLSVVGLLATAQPLAADLWYQHYENAREALDREDWVGAVEELNLALERKGDPGRRVRTYGMNVVDYFPYLKLGIAYHGLGQHEAALEAFDTEERLGVVLASESATQELERYRGLAETARQESAESIRDNTRQAVTNSLEQARALAQQDRLDEAMNALGSGLAVAPEDPDLVALMDRLRSRVVERERQRRDREAAVAMTEQARERLAAGEPQEAASLLRQVMASTPSEEARRLLAQAQNVILANVAADERAEQVDEALAAARLLADQGRSDEALDRLELVFALEGDHAAATALRDRLLEERRAARDRQHLQDTIGLAEGLFSQGRFAEALSAANRVLALESSDPAALALVRRAYAEISRRVLDGPGLENLPPAIRFADGRSNEGGELIHRVENADFLLSGVTIDRSPVEIAVAAVPEAGAEIELESTVTSQAVGDYFVTEFRIRHGLTPGASEFRVTATDSEGLSSNGVYVVHYARPWFRAPWLYLLASGLLALGIASALARRSSRRRQRLRRRFNPYIAGVPIFDEKLFFGREALVQRILQTVHNNSLLLHGERRIGKTSLLHQVRQRLEELDDPAYAFYPVYIDLQGTPEERFFAYLGEQIREALGPELGESFSAGPESADAAYGHPDLVRELHRIISALRHQSSKQVKVVLLIDEVDELNHYDPRVNQKLRSLFMKRFAESLVAVVAGVGIRKEWEREASPWYNFFEEIEVREIPAEDACRLVLEPIRGVFRVEPGVAEKIVADSDGKPYPIQRRCLALVNRLHDEGRRTITLADVAALEKL